MTTPDLSSRRSGGLRQTGTGKQSLPGKPLISVITVVYNGVKNFEQTLRSVVTQTYSQVEYIVIDGGSTDGTLDLIQKHNDSIDYWISEKDRGIYDAMNKGIELARGEWINFMNCGDRFASDSVLEMFSGSVKGADILYGDCTVEYGGFEAPFPRYPIHTLWKNSPFCHQACFVRTTLMREYKFDLQYKVGADHNLFYRAYMEKKKFVFVEKQICFFDGKEGTTKKWIYTAVRDKMNIAMKYEPSWSVWLYYKIYIAYIYLLLLFKQIVGPRITLILTRIVKGKA